MIVKSPPNASDLAFSYSFANLNVSAINAQELSQEAAFVSLLPVLCIPFGTERK